MLSTLFRAQQRRRPWRFACPQCSAPTQQVRDSGPMNGYNRRPLSELASPYFVDLPDRLVPPKNPGENPHLLSCPTLPPGFAMTGAEKLTSGRADLREVASQYSVQFQV